VTEVDNQRWSTIFYHREAIYLLGVYEAFGNAVIRRSVDGGRKWTEPSDSENGLLAEGRFHCAPVPVVVHNQRVWRAMEDAPRGREFRTFMMSAPVDADLLDANSWTFSDRLPYKEKWNGGSMRGWLEGNAVVAVSRTAYDDGIGGAANYHDANFITFHRVADFRSSLT
jgi:hypothetical protein